MTRFLLKDRIAASETSKEKLKYFQDLNMNKKLQRCTSPIYQHKDGKQNIMMVKFTSMREKELSSKTLNNLYHPFIALIPHQD